METLRNIALTGLAGLFLALVFYVGMTNQLCNRIDTFTAQEQSSMKLDANACALPWYRKL